MRGLRGAIRLQFQIVLSDRGYLNDILANPFFAIIFLGIVRAAGRRDLTAFAVVAPVLITLWGMALEIAATSSTPTAAPASWKVSWPRRSASRLSCRGGCWR